MSLRNWFNRSRKIAEHADADLFRFLHPADRFLRLLETERLRADRTGDEFSLVVFRIDPLDTKALNAFATVLKERLRTTDHAGRFGKTNDDIAVILWDTGIEGTHRFTKALREKCAGTLPEHEIYVYPTDPPFFDDNGKPADPSEKFVIRRNNLHDPLPQVRPLEVLFVKPLPVWKRTVDLLGAGIGLVLLSPLLLLIAVLVKLTSRGPVLFTQIRDGLGGRQFRIIKFRTMVVGADAQQAGLRRHNEQDGPCFKISNDPRLTAIGRYLRKSCLDELPQFWNVLKGDMTLVGPRPLDSRETCEITGWKRRRMEVTPGLTCIWQVHGKPRVSFAEWMRMDIRYLADRTFLRDANLIAQTAVSVVLHKASV